jgi:hypothetical protein
MGTRSVIARPTPTIWPRERHRDDRGAQTDELALQVRVDAVGSNRNPSANIFTSSISRVSTEAHEPMWPPCQRFARNGATRNPTMHHAQPLDSGSHLQSCVGT